MVSSRPYNQTGVKLQTLLEIGRSLIRVPEDFEVHSDVVKLLQSRKRMLDTGDGEHLHSCSLRTYLRTRDRHYHGLR